MEHINQIHGYKAFNKGLTNRYGFEFELGKLYSIEGELQGGNHGNGFHFCKNIEDVLRYFDGLHDDIDICTVIGSGEYLLKEDEYYGYYDMYVTQHLEILKILSREEILAEMNNMHYKRLERFIKGYKLSENELENSIENMQPIQQKDLRKVYVYYQK